MSAAIRDLLEKISELEWALKQAMDLPDDFDMGEAYESWHEMTQDPTWCTDTSSAPPNFYDSLQDQLS